VIYCGIDDSRRPGSGERNDNVNTASTPLPARTLARPDSSFHSRPDVRLFATDQELACRQDPELFFEPRKRRRAIKLCAECPFRGRCAYNAVATRATHGIWAGIMLPGHFPDALKPLYAAFLEQFEQRRLLEVGDIPVALLAPVVDDEEDPDTDIVTAAALIISAA
jgi:WhiB family transcriptional regulator, redox-sensing transcriptional regulator